MRKYLYVLLLSLLSGTPVICSAEPAIFSVNLRWNRVQHVTTAEGVSEAVLSFEGSIVLPGHGNLPGYSLSVPLQEGQTAGDVSISNILCIPLTAEECKAITDPEMVPSGFVPSFTVQESRGASTAIVTLFPFRKNASGAMERLISFDLTLSVIRSAVTGQPLSGSAFADHSVLASGTWYKISVSNPGMQIITYDDLKSFGIDPGSIDPRNIRIFSNGGGMLPELNSAARIDDLKENAIVVSGEADGKFDPSDYILFYGESQTRWTYDETDFLFHHTKNLYADKTFYFLTIDQGAGKRVTMDPGTTETPTNIIVKFNDYGYYEQDDLNLIMSGREWYDKQVFDVTSSRNYPFVFPNIDTASAVTVTSRVVGRSTSGSSSFTMAANGQTLKSIQIPSVPDQFLATYARERSGSGSFYPTGQDVEVKLTFNKPNASAIGYLNFIEVNAMRRLTFNGGQMNFRSVVSAGPGKVGEFRMETQGQAVEVWDVSETGDAMQLSVTNNQNKCTFRVNSETLKEFVAFDRTSLNSPTFEGRVDNQDLHGAGNYNYVIVTHSSFLPEAERLAEFHRSHDGYSVLVTTADKVYNEFSSGAQDISAIRDFVRMMYSRTGTGTALKHLLLFGDASYDYKDRMPNNTNYVPAYQSAESLNPVDTYVTDDYFGLLDPNEGTGAAGLLDIGVGRLPVQTPEEATSAVDKILHYCSDTIKVKEDWRNVLCFVADDEDGNLHMEQVEDLTNAIGSGYPVYNIDKIYLDAYQQVSTPGGQRCPDVNDAINKRVAKGALIISYTGHGGEVGWAHERILEVPDIKAWTNFDHMPVFVTATCEFSRYDDPARQSAGELVFSNPNGGGIALFTTTRPTFAGANFALASNFYNVAFEKVNGEYLRMGDLILLAKNATSADANTRKFVLLGDPGLKMAYPQYSVVTTTFNGRPSGTGKDTLEALSEITLTGEVRDNSGQRMTRFNGEVFTTVYDKPSEIQTIGGDNGASMSFSVRKNQIYKGQVEVSDGQFSLSFIVPKDIAYDFGEGKISYYARNNETDANGFDANIVIGGYNNEARPDMEGPGLDLYMNDKNFVNGSITGASPVLLAFVSDESGINTIGNGIGHDITAVLDDNSAEPMILNDYYVADLNTYKSGIISYPLEGLSEGRHHITVKVWDVYNNSSQATISFVVIGSPDLKLQSLKNYPNPFRDQTTFTFETNVTDTQMDLVLSIYNLRGQVVRTLSQTITATGYKPSPITWDGTSDDGWKLDSGIYVYVMRVRLPDGSEMNGSSKLILVR